MANMGPPPPKAGGGRRVSSSHLRRSFDAITDADAQEKRDDDAIKAALQESWAAP